MINQGNTLSISSKYDAHWHSTMLLNSRFISEVRESWEQSGRANLADLLEKFPKIKQYRSFVLDLAYEEYRHRLEKGESLDVDEFSRQFPSYQKSLYFLIEVHKLLDNDPHFRILQDTVSWPNLNKEFLGFTILSELGRGTFARVYLASESALGGRMVALKVALHGSDEAETLGKLKHPNIVPIYSIQEEAKTGLTAICMPYLGRTTLYDVLDNAFSNNHIPEKARLIVDTILKTNDINESETASFDPILYNGLYVEGIIHLAIQIAEALEYTHSQGICHGDLKPTNVLLSLEGRPLLLDFNLSVGEHFAACRIGGTLPYMAPEQLELVMREETNGSNITEPRTDIFSLGVILYQLLSGDLPFTFNSRDSSIEQAAKRLLKEQAKGPCELHKKNKFVDLKLSGLIQDCLAFNPEQRPKSAGAFIKAIRKELSTVRRVQRLYRYHSRLSGLITGIVFLSLLAGMVCIVNRAPYSTRQFQSGLIYCNAGKYDLAISCFNKSLEDKTNQSDVLFARGKAYKAVNNYHSASADFKASFLLAPKPETIACQGYCANKLGYHKEAIEYYERCLAAESRSEIVLNNLGFSYFKINKMTEASRYLEQALAIDDKLQSAHHILVIIAANRALNGFPILDSALDHAKKAIETGPPSAELYFNVGSLYSLAAKKDSALINPALECLEAAVDYGINSKSFLDNPAFSTLKEEQRLKSLLMMPPGKKLPMKSQYLIDPLKNDSSFKI